MSTQMPISLDEIAIRYRQPYVSEALNRKAAAESGGIRKGFRMTLEGAQPNNVVFKVDEQDGLSVMNIANGSDPEFMVTWLRTSDLEVVVPFAASWFHLFINHGYTLNNETEPTMTWYTSAEVLAGNRANFGMYIGSAFGVAEGAQITEIRTSFSLSDGSLLKRATASTSSGSRTRVRGYDEEAVFYTDFNGRSMTPIDLRPDRPNRLTTRVVTSKETAQLPVNGAALNLLDNYKPESNDSMLLIWRRDVDDINVNNPNGDPTEKRFVIPAHIPLRSVDTTDVPSTVRLFVRYSTLREDAQRFNDPTTWQVGIELATSRESRMGLGTIVGIDTALANATDISLARATLENTNQAWRWAVVDVEIPREDSTGPVNVIGASVIIDIPNMRSQESIAIDRILVESDVAPLTESADGHQSLMSSAVGRFSNYDLDHPSDTVITPSKRGLALHPAGDLLTHNTTRTVYAIERASHETQVGLPLRDETQPSRFEIGGEDFSVISSTNNAIDFGNLVNLFRQSSLVINAPGMYDTSALIAALEAANATIPDALRAPQRAGLTVNNGNVVVRKAQGSIKPDMTTTGSSPAHVTGALVADSVYFADKIGYATVDENGVVTQGQSGTYFASIASSDVVAQMTINFGYKALVTDIGRTFLSLYAVGALNSALSFLHADGEYDSTYYDANNLEDYQPKNLGLVVADASEVLETPAGIKSSMVIGAMSQPRLLEIGTTNLANIRVTRHTGSTQTLADSRVVATRYVADINDEQFVDGGDILFADTLAPTFTGAPLLFTTISAVKPRTWSNGVLSPVQHWHYRTQSVNRGEIDSYAVLKAQAEGFENDYTDVGVSGAGFEVRSEIRVDALSQLRRSRLTAEDAGIQVEPQSTTALLDYRVSVSSQVLSQLTDLDESMAYANIIHYLTPLKPDGSAYVAGEGTVANSIFRFQALANPNNFPAFVGGASSEHYYAPYIELSHEIVGIIQGDTIGLREGLRARGSIRYHLYEYIALMAQVGQQVGSLFAANIPEGVSPSTVTAAVFSTVGAATLPLNFGGLYYSLGHSPNYGVPKMTSLYDTLDNVQAHIRQSLSDDSIDLRAVNQDQRHIFSVAICYDAAFGAGSLATHPVVLRPSISELVVGYRSAYLDQ